MASLGESRGQVGGGGSCAPLIGGATSTEAGVAQLGDELYVLSWAGRGASRSRHSSVRSDGV